MTQEINLHNIRQTRAALPACIRRTPLVPLQPSGADLQLHVKAENLQITGAHKPRAAFAVVGSLPPERLRCGIVLASSGNFARAFAFAGRQLGFKVVVVMLDRTSSYKVEAAREYGAEVVFCGTDALARQPTVEAIARERSMTAVDTWEEPSIVSGHGSIGLEILEDFPDVETVLVPVSSGGGAAGIAMAIKECKPRVHVVGVQPERANAAFVSLQAGIPTTIDYWDTMADSLSAVRPGNYAFRLLQKYLDGIVLVSETEIASAIKTLLMRGKLLAEPAGAVSTAAFLSRRVEQNRCTVAVLTGGNIALPTFREIIA
jgi:threonine dehydratase